MSDRHDDIFVRENKRQRRRRRKEEERKGEKENRQNDREERQRIATATRVARAIAQWCAAGRSTAHRRDVFEKEKKNGTTGQE